MKSIEEIAQNLYQILDQTGPWEIEELDDGVTVRFHGNIDLDEMSRDMQDLILEPPCTHEDYGWRVHAGSFEGGGPLVATYSCESCLPATVGWAQFLTNIQAEVIKTEEDHRFGMSSGDE